MMYQAYDLHMFNAFFHPLLSPPLMAVEMWMFGFGLTYCYVHNTDLVQVFRCALFREM